MKKNTVLMLMGFSVIGYAAFSAAASTDEGAKVFNDVCTPCHSAGSRPLDNVRLSREQWQEQIDRMSGMGADVPSKKVPALLDYLVATHGPAANDKSKK